MQFIDRTESELSDTESKIRLLEDRKIYQEGLLVQVSPMGTVSGQGGEQVQDPITRLKMLRSQYFNVSARYSSDHPDVLQIKRQIEALEKSTGSVDSSGEQAKELSRLRAELATAREKYSTDHPDVVRLTKAVTAQEEALKKRLPPTPERLVAEENPQNPAYITLKSQITSDKNEIEALIVKRNELKIKLADYEKKMIQTPEVEREYLALMRDYENSVRKYQDIKAKQLEAEVGQELEKERKGERFSLIDPPQLPEEPIKPNRPAILFLGLIFSLGSSLGYVAVAEAMGNTVRSRSLAIDLGTSLLSVIPYKQNQGDIDRKLKTKKLVITAIAASLVVVVILAHLLWTPLDVLWFKGLRKADGIIGG